MKKQGKLIKTIINDFEKVRSKEFMEYFYDFIAFFDNYFKNQAIEYIESLDNYSIKKFSLSEKQLQELEKKLTFVFLLWQQEVKTKTDLELNNIWIKVDIVINNDYWLDYAKNRAWELISEIDETTKEQLSWIIEYGIKNGNTLQEIALSIDNKFLNYSTYRSSLIAVMEVWNSYEYGARKQHDEYTEHFWVVWYKKSTTQWDSNARETHKQNEEAWWILKTEPFPWTWTDHAPHEFNCRCYTDYSVFEPVNWEV